MNVGVVGLGAMGAPMARHLLTGGHSVCVYARRAGKDIHIVLNLARALGIELPASAAAAEVLNTLQARGGARQDTAAVFTILATPDA